MSTADRPAPATAPGAGPADDLVSWRGISARSTGGISHDEAEAEDSGALADDHDLGAARAGDARRLLGSLLSPHRVWLAVVVLVTVVQQAALLAGPLLIGVAIDRGIPDAADGDTGTIALIAAAYAVAGVAVALSEFAFAATVARVGQSLLADLRERIFTHAQRLSLDFHEKYTSGRLLSRATGDVDAVRELLDEGLDGLVSAALTFGVSLGFLFFLDVPLALVVAAGLLPSAVVLRWYRRRSATLYRRTRTSIAAAITQYVETFNGIRAVQAFRREPRNRQIFRGLNARYTKANADTIVLFGWVSPLLRLIGGATLVAVLASGAYRVADGSLDVGVLTAFMLYVLRMYDPVDELAMFLNTYQSAAAGLEKIAGLLAHEPGIAEPAVPEALPPRGGGQPGGKGRAVVFDRVRFGYQDGVTVLPHLDLAIPAGQTVALVGATGAGKSTVAKLLARFHEPTEGAVRLDGVDVRDLATPALRAELTVVTQESFLFSGSVADNIALGRPDASRADVEDAARAIGAYRFITELPDGFDTDVRKRGARLSAGQRQLVAFARALLADPAVLVLDEATSSLDIPGERAVQRALATVLEGRTAVIIAHRLSTVEVADRVLVVEDGRIVEDGSPEDLVGAGGDGRFGALHKAWRESLV